MPKGFKFRNIHSNTYGIVCTPNSRIVLPEKRRSIIDIPGRSGSYAQNDGTYNSRTESIHVAFTKPAGKTLSAAVRDIASWLSVDGVLEFDDEPGKFYNAAFTGSIPLINHPYAGEFDLTFVYLQPFAYTAEQQRIQTVTSSADQISIAVNGTADTPCRITIYNTGETTIDRIRVTRKTE